MLKRLIFGVALLAFPAGASAGPKEDAQAVFEKFLTTFTAAKVEDVVALFAPDALFYGTTMRDVGTDIEAVRKYFIAAFGAPNRGPVKASMLGTPSFVVLSEGAALMSGMWQTERVVDGKPTMSGGSRITMAMVKRGDRWQIAQFHNSPRPTPPQ